MNKILAVISDEIRENITIEGVDIELGSGFVLEDVLVLDNHKRSLFYSSSIVVALDYLVFEKKKIGISYIQLFNPELNIIKYRGTSEWNYQFIADIFSSADSLSLPWEINISKIAFFNSSVSILDKHAIGKPKAISTKDLSVLGINGEIRNFHYSNSGISGKLIEVSLRERSGFALNNLTANIAVSPTELIIDSVQVQTQSSSILSYMSFYYHDYNDYATFSDSVQIHTDIINSKISLKDIGYFSNVLKGIDYQISLSATLDGTLSQLKGRNIDIAFGNKGRIKGGFSVKGLPDYNETFLNLRVKKLTAYQEDLEGMPLSSINDGQELIIPKLIRNLGKINFKGDFTGFHNDFVAFGEFKTDRGMILSDLSLKEDSISENIKYSGNLSSSYFDAGHFLGISDKIGTAAFNVNIDGTGIENETANMHIGGAIHGIYIYDYYYENIIMEGRLAKNSFSGALSVNDDNIDFGFNGKIDMTTDRPVFDFNASVNYANLKGLKISKRDSGAVFSGLFRTNFSGNNLNDMIGVLVVRDINYQFINEDKNNVVHDFGALVLTATGSGKTRNVNLSSDFMDANLAGDFDVNKIGVSLRSALLELTPNAYWLKDFSKNKTPDKRVQDFSCNVTIQNITPLLSVLIPGAMLSGGSRISLDYSNQDKTVSAQGVIGSAGYKGSGFRNLRFAIDAGLSSGSNTGPNTNNDLEMKVNGSCDKLILLDSLYLRGFSLGSVICNDSMSFQFDWDNKVQPQYAGNLNGYVLFKKAPLGKITSRDNYAMAVLHDSWLSIADSIWNIQGSNPIVFDQDSLSIEQWRAFKGNKQIQINGQSSINDPGGIKISFDGFNLSVFNQLTLKKGLRWVGVLEGDITLSDIFKAPYAFGKISIEDMGVNDKRFGNLEVSSKWNRISNKLNMQLELNNGEASPVLINGFYDLSAVNSVKEGPLDFAIVVKKFRPHVLQPFVRSVFSEISSRSLVSGEIHLGGSIKKPILTGGLRVKKGGARLAYTHVDYNFADKVIFKDSSISFEKLVVYDMKGNQALVNGHIYHTFLRNFRYDIQVKPEKFHSLSTTEEQNKLYYGQGYATGLLRLSGARENLVIESNIKTQSGTRIYVPLMDVGESASGGFVNFVNSDKDFRPVLNNSADPKPLAKSPEISFDIEITPEAEIQLIFDKTVGDVLKAKGYGNLQLKIDHTGEFNMYGTYVIENGDYLFTLQKVINKRFKIEEGGNITWNGDPYNAVIDLKAKYSLNASLYDLTLDLENKRRIPVECKLSLTGDILNPEIGFDIDFPNMDPSNEAAVKALLLTDQQLNKQIFSLLVLGRFQPALGIGDAAGGIVSANSSELLSNQLSNWLSRINEDFDIGINYRPGDEITNREVEVALSTQLFNDRLSINGSVGNNPDISTQNSSEIVGDFDINYKITKEGQVRVKAYNHANESYLSTDNAPYTQGLGLFYMKEFDSLKDLFKRKEKLD